MQAPASPSATEIRDADLVRRIQHHDPEALNLLMRAYADLLGEIVSTIVDSNALVEEVVQEVFIWIWDARDRLHIRGRVSAYLVHAARNTALKRLRHERSQRRIVEELRHGYPTGGPTTTNTGEGRLLAAELRAAIVAALRALPPRTREIFVLHAQHGLSAPEIAAMLGVTPATVHTQVYRATKRLAIELEGWL